VTDPFYESRQWLELRYLVLEASNGVCQCCGQQRTKNNPLQVDHIKPRSKFPELELSPNNLQVLCRECNLGKGNKSERDWRFLPSISLQIQNSLKPEVRRRLRRLNSLALNSAGSKELRSSAQKEHRRLWREAVMRWRAKNLS
jgi:hypothetical protein